MEFPMRINKYLAKSGYATRRSADRLIAEGRVFVNGAVALLGQKIMEDDLVEIKDFDTDGFRYLLYYKPAGLATLASREDEHDVVRELKQTKGIEGLFPVGRLDKSTEGLLVLTSDGRVTSAFQEIEVTQTYEVVVDKSVMQATINRINRGVKIESHIAKTAHASPIAGNPRGMEITLSEHKKYNVRSICAALGLKVVSLKRTKFFDFELRRLKPGEFYELKPKEAEELRHSLGLK